MKEIAQIRPVAKIEGPRQPHESCRGDTDLRGDLAHRGGEHGIRVIDKKPCADHQLRGEVRQSFQDTTCEWVDAHSASKTTGCTGGQVKRTF
jgi:hypothetical protein